MEVSNKILIVKQNCLLAKDLVFFLMNVWL